jgi:hypothetical protein
VGNKTQAKNREEKTGGVTYLLLTVVVMWGKIYVAGVK